jgi:hypothetical protein
MIFYKVKQLAAPCTITEFDDPEEAIRGAMSYDHEHEVLMSDSQDPLGNDVRFAYIWLNKIHLGAMASSEFIAAAKKVGGEWPYKVA